MNVDAFIGYLKNLSARKDRRALAALRRGLGKPAGHAIEMAPYVIPFLGEKESKREMQIRFLIASLFAYHPESANHGNFGNQFGILRRKRESESIEHRFRALLSAHFDSLGYHLRQAVGLLKSSDISVCWQQLYIDLIYWDHPEKFVQINWAKQYYAGQKETEVDLNGGI